MNDGYTRRKFMAGLGATSVVSLPFGNTVSPTTRVIDVNFFVGENIIDVASDDDSDTETYTNPGAHRGDNETDDNDPLYPIKRITEHVEYAFADLFSRFDSTIEIDISIVDDPVPVDDFEPDSSALLRPWEDYLYNTVDASERADDSNILFVLDPATEYDWKGNAYYPCSVCHGGQETAGVVYDVNHGPFADISPGEIRTEYAADSMRSRIATTIHEVGHTIGLRHPDGEVRENDGKKITTPMIDSGNVDGEIVREITFNSGITESDIRDDTNSGIPFGNIRRSVSLFR